MCPFCIATVAALAVKAASAGGVGAIVIGRIVKGREAKQTLERGKVKEKEQ